MAVFGIGGTINGWLLYSIFLNFIFSATITLPLYLTSFICFAIEYKEYQCRKNNTSKEWDKNKLIEQIVSIANYLFLYYNRDIKFYKLKSSWNSK